MHYCCMDTRHMHFTVHYTRHMHITIHYTGYMHIIIHYTQGIRMDHAQFALPRGMCLGVHKVHVLFLIHTRGWGLCSSHTTHTIAHAHHTPHTPLHMLITHHTPHCTCSSHTTHHCTCSSHSTHNRWFPCAAWLFCIRR